VHHRGSVSSELNNNKIREKPSTTQKPLKPGPLLETILPLGNAGHTIKMRATNEIVRGLIKALGP